ncbi:MAG: DUF6188 family protein [Gemmatimonadaceae bacterium]
MESLWRITVDGSLRLTSTDNGQQFGLPAPVDAHARASDLLVGRRITHVGVDEARGDFTATFDNGSLLEAITDSGGYESWILRGPGRLIVSVSGGTVRDESPEV